LKRKLKNLFFLLFFLKTLSLFAQKQSQSGLQTVRNFGQNKGGLQMRLHVPTNDSAKAIRKPLVVVLHGCSQNADAVAAQSGWNKIADAQGFYVVYPQQRLLNNPSGCFNWFLKNNVAKDKGELGSIREMIAFMQTNYAIDSSQIFVYGLSAGAAMSVALLVQYPELFKSGAICAGGAFPDFTNPLSVMPIVVLHGTADLVVNPQNSQELVKQWTGVARCDSLAPTVVPNFTNNPRITLKTYQNQAKQTVVRFYSIQHLGHSLPIAQGTAPHQGGETGLFATDIGWHSTFYIAKDFGLIK
jgi:poly(3-hydroxybutyrate) depolymerase